MLKPNMALNVIQGSLLRSASDSFPEGAIDNRPRHAQCVKSFRCTSNGPVKRFRVFHQVVRRETNDEGDHHCRPESTSPARSSRGESKSTPYGEQVPAGRKTK